MALTFDDGPDPEATPAVLDALDAIGARATFFMVGEQAEVHPGLALEVAERGHGIGLHGWRHVRPDGLDDPAGDLQRALSVLEQTTGVAPKTFRPPYGHFTPPLYGRPPSSVSNRSCGRPGGWTGSRSRLPGSPTSC